MQPASLSFVVREPGESVRIKVSLLTPMLGGGPIQGKPDPEQPFRAKSIRGHLRWWYRRVVKVESPEELWEKESRLFGSAGKDPDDAIPGRVRIVVEQPSAKKDDLVKNVGDFTQHRYAWGMFGSEKTIKQNGPDVLQRHSATISFVGLDDDGLLALAAWVLFGGIGARTHRGFGSLLCDEGAETLPSYASVVQALRHNGLAIAGGKGCAVFRSTRIPVEEKSVTEAGLKAWKEALDWYEAFRRGNLRPDVHRPSNGSASHSRWPEANSVRFATGRRQTPESEVREFVFPKASLGLPLTIRSAPGSSEFGFNAVELEVDGGKRWPSPVITKAVWREGKAEPTIVILRGGGPTPEQVRARGNRDITAQSLSAQDFPKEWFDGQQFKAVPEIHGKTAREKLASFLRYVRLNGHPVWEEVK